jgi:hypothetical protein
LKAEAQASQQGGVDAQLEPGQELLVTDQEQAEGWLGVAPVARQEPHFLQSGGTEVLGFVQDNDGPETFQQRHFLSAMTDLRALDENNNGWLRLATSRSFKAEESYL